MQMLPWTLMLPHGCSIPPHNQQKAALAAAVSEFFTTAVSGACRRPFEAWAAIEKLALEHSQPAAGKHASKVHTEAAQQVLCSASTSGLPLLFAVFRSALRRFRRSDAATHGDGQAGNVVSAHQDFQEADEMVWTYVAGVVRLVLPHARFAAVFAAGLLGLTVEELEALSSRCPEGAPQVTWTCSDGALASISADSLTIAGGQCTPPAFLTLVEWLWGVSRRSDSGHGVHGVHDSSELSSTDLNPAANDRDTELKGQQKKKRKCAEQPMRSVQWDVRVGGRMACGLIVQPLPSMQPQEGRELPENGCFSKAQAALALLPDHAADAQWVLPAPVVDGIAHALNDDDDEAKAVSPALNAHDKLMWLCVLLDHACSQPCSSGQSVVSESELLRAFRTVKACASQLPGAHLQLLSHSCIAMLRWKMEGIPGHDGRRGSGEAEVHPTLKLPSKKKRKSSGRRQHQDRSAIRGGDDLRGLHGCAIMAAAAVCVESLSPDTRRQTSTGKSSDVSRAACSVILRLSRIYGEHVALEMASPIPRLCLSMTLLFVQKGLCMLPVDCGIQFKKDSGAMSMAADGSLLTNMALLLATAASQGLSDEAAVSAEQRNADAMMLSQAAESAVAGDTGDICQLLSHSSRSMLLLLPETALYTAFQLSLRRTQKPRVDSHQEMSHAACLFVLAETWVVHQTKYGIDRTVAVEHGLLQACSLACKCLAHSRNSTARPAALSFIHCFFTGLSAAQHVCRNMHPASVKAVMQPPDDSLLHGALASNSAAQVALPAACLRTAINPSDAFAVARLLQADQAAFSQPLHLSRLARVLASVLMAADGLTQSTTEVLAAAKGVASAVRAPVLRMLVRGLPSSSADKTDGLREQVDWPSVGCLVLLCLQFQPLQVRMSSLTPESH